MIFRKAEIAKHLEEYKVRSGKLLNVLNGEEPDKTHFDKYINNPADFSEEFTNIDIGELDYLIDDFQTSLKKLKKLKSCKAKHLHRHK